jgi:zinc protease
MTNEVRYVGWGARMPRISASPIYGYGAARAALAVALLLVATAGSGWAQSAFREVLPSGLTMVVNEFHGTQAVEVVVAVRAGPMYEGVLTNSGASALLQRILVNSAQTGVSADEVKRAIAQLGNQFQASTTVTYTSFRISTTSDRCSEALALLASMICNYNYNQVDLERERKALTNGRSESGMSSEDELLGSILYHEHPARFPVAGMPKMTERLDLDLMKRYQASRYTTANTVVIVVGNVNANEVRKSIEHAFSKELPGGFQPVPSVVEPPQFGPRFASAQANLATPKVIIGWRTESVEHSNQPALAVLAQLLGDSRSGLVRKALVDKGLSTAVAVDCRAPVEQPGYLAVSFEALVDKRAEAEQAVHACLAELAKNGPLAADIDAAKRRLRYLFAQRQSSVHLISDDLLQWELSTGDPSYGARFSDQVEAVTADDVVRVLRRYIVSDNVNRSCTVVLKPAGDSVAVAGKTAEPTGSLKPEQSTVSTGVTLLLRPAQEMPLTHVRLTFGGGSSAEDERAAGVTAVLAELMAHATQVTSASDLDALLEAKGMQLAVTSDCQALSIALTCFPEDAVAAVQLICDMATRPSFEAADIDQARARVLRKLERSEQSVEQRLLAHVREVALESHYAARHPYGTKDSLAAADRAAVHEQYRKIASPRNLCISVYGNFDQAAVTAALGQRLEEHALPGQAAAQHPAGSAPTSPGSPISVRYYDTPQTAMALSWPAPPLGNRATDEAPMAVLSAILAGVGGPGGRINRTLAVIDHDIRVLALPEAYNQRGLWTVWGQVDDTMAEVVREAVKEQVAGVIAQLKDESKPLSESELNAAKAMCVTGYTLAQEDQAAAALRHATTVVAGASVDLDVGYPQRIDAVTVEDLLRVANLYLAQEPVIVLHRPRKTEAAEPLKERPKTSELEKSTTAQSGTKNLAEPSQQP